LGTDRTRESTITGYLNGQIEGTVTGTEGPLEIYVIHSDDYVDASSISSFDCIVYEYTASSEFSFSVLKEGDWVLVLRNPNSYDVHYSFSWTSTEPEEIIVNVVAPVAIPSFLFVIALGYIITVQRGVIPDFEDGGRNSQLSSTIGFVFILASLLLPIIVQLNILRFEVDMLVSLLWTLYPRELNLHFTSPQNPFNWIMPLTLFGPTLLYPFAIMQYYQGRKTRKQTIIIGFASLIPVIVPTLLGALALLLSPSYPLVVIPLPLVYILGLIITKYIPAVRENHEGAV
jgi:hypothetical protein